MRILLMTRRLAAAGAERQLVVLATALRRRGHDVHTAVFYEGGELTDELRRADVPIHHLRKRRHLDFLGPIRNLIKLVDERRIEAVYSFNPGENIATAVLKLARRGVRVVWGVHSGVRDVVNVTRFARLVYRVETWLSRIPDAILAVSEAACDAAIGRGMARRAYAIVPNAVDVAMFTPQPEAALAFRRELNLGNEPLIGIVGRIVPIKDHPLFLAAAAELRARRDDVRFLIVGDGPAEWLEHLRDVERKLAIDSATLWLGIRRDLPAVYSALDILTLCSHSEGFGNVIGEAMACGTPCVATNVGAAAGLIGDTGRVITERTPKALAAAWETMLTTRSVETKAKPRQRIVDMYAADVIAARVETVLRGDTSDDRDLLVGDAKNV